jgi:hypothetical protein
MVAPLLTRRTPALHFPVFPMRQVHLDFHTAPQIPDVGADWDPDHFVRTLQEARVNSITVFASCHHGMFYYPTQVGTVHPSLKFDLLGEQIEALHKAGIRAPIYITVVWSVDQALQHPEWRQVDRTGKQVGPSPLDPGWPWLCVNNEYADLLAAQTEELLARYDCDGFFYDIVMYHGDGCLCHRCLPEMRKAGMDPDNPAHRRAHNHQSARTFMERMTRIIRGKLPDAGIYYNSRWGLHFADEHEHYSQVEIESLPTGGWGYAFYPLWSRYGRNFDLPMLGMTGPVPPHVGRLGRPEASGSLEMGVRGHPGDGRRGQHRGPVTPARQTERGRVPGDLATLSNTSKPSRSFASGRRPKPRSACSC